MAGRQYDDATRERALELMRDAGLAAAHHQLGIPKQTLSRWAKAGGVDLGEIVNRTRAGTAARAAQLAETTVDRLEYVLDLATTTLTRSLEALADVVELDDEDLGVWSDELERFVPPEDARATAAAMRRQQLIMSTGVPLRELVGVTTRAIHDLALLKGEATERGEIAVTFHVPRPQPQTVVVVEQEALGITP